MKVLVGNSWPNEAKVSNVVVPEPKPRCLLPLGTITPPNRLRIHPVLRRDHISRLMASVASPTPPYQVCFSPSHRTGTYTSSSLCMPPRCSRTIPLLTPG